MSISFEHIQDHLDGCLPCGLEPGNHSQGHTIKERSFWLLLTTQGLSLSWRAKNSSLDRNLINAVLSKQG